MDFATEILAQLVELRRDAEALMFDTAEVRRPAGLDINEDTGVATALWSDVYAGKCKISGDRAYEINREVGGATLSVQRYLFHVPVTTGPFNEGDVVTITASRTQPHLVGNVYRIAGRDERSTQTAQRMYVEFI